MAKKTVFELAEDIADPSDFTGQHGLIQLDNALRCSICQELYDGPVSITCGHCFCSLVRSRKLGCHGLTDSSLLVS